MDPSLMRALAHRQHRRRHRPRRRDLALQVMALVANEIAITVTQTVVLSQRLTATGPLASARYRR